MKISEGDDNLIKCNRIPSESATGESLGYSTHSNAEISRICSFDFILKERERRKKFLQVTGGMLFLRLCTNLTEIEKNRRNYFKYKQCEFTLSKRWTEWYLSTLHFAKNKCGLWLQITNCTMLYNIFPLKTPGIIQDQPPNYYMWGNIFGFKFIK